MYSVAKFKHSIKTQHFHFFVQHLTSLVFGHHLYYHALLDPSVHLQHRKDSCNKSPEGAKGFESPTACNIPGDTSLGSRGSPSNDSSSESLIPAVPLLTCACTFKSKMFGKIRGL